MEEKETPVFAGDPDSFENEFLEVEVKPALNWGVPINSSLTVPYDKETGVPHFLRDEIDPEYEEVDEEGLENSLKTREILTLYFTGIMYRKLRLETDVSGKSDRVEWGHARYQAVFRPDQAYELIAEWLTSSGSIVGELVS